ncbi:MAG: hypothetical protein R8P61_26175 [Bacteroidia bacterium]|nr:hypothetical protein [Bacteroidia bacterium]
MASPFVITIVVLILVFFAANAVLFIIARMREANRDQQDKLTDEHVSDEEIEGFLGSKP